MATEHDLVCRVVVAGLGVALARSGAIGIHDIRTRRSGLLHILGVLCEDVVGELGLGQTETISVCRTFSETERAGFEPPKEC
jgi:hypothetical protein